MSIIQHVHLQDCDMRSLSGDLLPSFASKCVKNRFGQGSLTIFCAINVMHDVFVK